MRTRRQHYVPPRFTVAQYNALAPEEQAILLELLIKTFNLAADRFGWTIEGDMAVLGGAPAAAPRATPPAPAQATPEPQVSIPPRTAAIASRASSDRKPDLCLQYLATAGSVTLKKVTEHLRAQGCTARDGSPLTEGAVKVVLWRLKNAGKVRIEKQGRNKTGLYSLV